MATPAPPRTTVVPVGLKLALMSFVSGCTDILCYLHLGHVFTSAMTGNAALLGLGLGQGDILAASRNMAALAGFLTGLGLGAALTRGPQDEPGWSRAVTRALLAEEVLFVAFAALWHLGAGPGPGSSFDGPLLYSLIVVPAVAMGVQSTVAQRSGVPGVATTYFTGTLTSIVVGAVDRNARPTAATGRRSRRIPWPAFAFLAYIMGAAFAGFLLLHPGLTPVLAPAIRLPALPAVMIAIVLLMAFADEVSGAIRAKRAGQGRRV